VKRFLSALALLLGACASTDNPGTAPAPATAWTPPASAVPPVTKFEVPLPPASLTLADIVSIALTNNPATREAWLNARTAEANLGSRRSAYYPEVDVNANLGRSIVGASAGRSAAASTTFSPSVALSYLLFDFGGRAATVEEARQTLIAADFEHNQAIQDVILAHRAGYYDYLDAKALLDRAGRDRQRAADQLDTAEARHNAGVATIADVLQARTALSQAQLIASDRRKPAHARRDARDDDGTPGRDALRLRRRCRHVATQQTTQAVDALIAQAPSTVPRSPPRAPAPSAPARASRKCAPRDLPSVTLNSSAGRTFFFAPSALGGTNSVLRRPRAALPALHRLPQHVRRPRGARSRRAGAGGRARPEQQIGLQVWTSYYALQTAKQRIATSRDLLASAQESVTSPCRALPRRRRQHPRRPHRESALETARARKCRRAPTGSSRGGTRARHRNVGRAP
jgi:outer membrane protein